MRRGIKIILAGLMIASSMDNVKSTSLTVCPNTQKKSSKKLHKKQTKSKPNSQYKSSKPIKSKCTNQFRNKSNI